MLRSSLIVIGALAIAIGLVALVSGAVKASLVFIAWGAVLAAGLVFERFRYKALSSTRPGPGWERSPERFIDEDTGKMVTVYIQPKTGERLYVTE